jgi:hypothetical protein
MTRTRMHQLIAAAVLSTSVPGVEVLAAVQWGDDQGRQAVYLHLKASEAEVVKEFERRLQDYDGVRRRLDASLPVQSVTNDPERILRVVEAHKSALRSERSNAAQGDIFFDDLVHLIRARIRESLHGLDPKEFLAVITEADAPPVARPGINVSYPDEAALTAMPPQLLQMLPALPADLRYGFINRDLILWDLHANLIIDIVADALPVSDKS